MKERNLSLHHVDILRLISDGFNTNSMISKRLKISRNTLKPRLDELLEFGLLRKIVAGTARVYELTEDGKIGMTKFSGGSESSRDFDPDGFRIHNVRWSSVIERKPWKLGDILEKNNFIPSQTKNWAQYTWNNKEEGVTILFTPSKVHFFINEFWSKSPMEYYPIAQKKLLKIAKGLEEKFSGLKLGSPERLFMIHKQHVAATGVLSKLAESYELHTGKRVTYHGDRVHLDRSKGYYEEETVDDQEAPMDMENLVDYFNEWTKSPFWPKDVKAISDKTAVLESENKESFKKLSSQMVENELKMTSQHEDLRDAMALLGRQHEILSRDNGVISNGMLALQQAQNSTSETFRENLVSLSSNLSDMSSNFIDLIDRQGAVVAGNTEAINVFGVAMREHVALVTELQSVTRNFKQAWETSLEQQQAFNLQLVKTMQEGFKPWYVKLADFIKIRVFKRSKQ